MKNVVKVKKLDPRAIIPSKSTSGAACFDVSCIEDVLISVGHNYTIRTGLAFEVPEWYYLEIVPRSGLSSKGLMLANSPATLDSDYRGELLLLLYLRPNLWNCSILPDYNRFMSFKAGDRIVQCRLHKVEPCKFVEATELSSTVRADGGLGHTGTKPLTA